ncbi:ATP-binding protein [Thalassobaculum sp. OXR-137]|uniref:ATP-binding protein n=1 Tax=Thalassobaculum sp. OXR-137 TaxID=3100173 RepID=UPI002AC8A2B5|nr:ATP-binding protein [Thalassobaculum sp. OXR-137]WPZ35942.1 ATP-binding protein [Thalassobaculum sp. OXR-137]
MPHRAPRFRPTQLSLLALLAIFTAIGAAVLAVSIYISIERQIDRPTENWQWAVYQLQAEHLKLMSAAQEAKSGEIDYGALQERYEIFVSRILTVNQGEAYRGLRESPELKDLLPAILQAVDLLDAMIVQDDPPAFVLGKRLEETLERFAEPLQAAALDVVAFSAGIRAAERNRIHDEMLSLMICLSVMLVISGLLGGVTIKQIAELSGSRRRLTEALTLAEKSNQAKSRFVASMSHEMRTPLNAMTGLLREIGHMTRNPEIARLVEVAQSSAGMLCGLVEDVIDVVRIESGKFQINATSFEVGPLLREAIDLLAERARDRNNILSLDMTDVPISTVRADRARIKQVLVNLIGNAVKFTRDGSVDVHARIAFVGRGQVRLRVSVCDTGIGIAHDQQERIFQRFYQTGEGSAEGIGLGLSISRDIVERLGGRMAMTSTPGQGSIFWFEVPVQVAVEAAAPEAPAPVMHRPLAGLRFLVAEDNGTNRQVIQLLLARLGGTCVFALDGLDAVAKARSEPCDLILMDINMPEMDGVTAFNEIGRLLGDARPPVIALTASAMPEDVEGFTAAGMAGCVTKPIGEADLVREILRALGRDPAAGLDTDSASRAPVQTPAPAAAPLTDRQRSAVLGLVAQLDDD